MATRKAAAIFDLDRTLLGDSSGLLISEALVEKGMMSDRDRSLAEIGRRFYKVVGETWIGMQITKRGISRISGWSQEDLRDAARRSIEHMDAAVYSEAREIIDRHRSEGHLVVIATSTGRDFVEPLADRLGVDKLIATEYEVVDGAFTGGFIGKWLWGPDKADAVLEFVESESIDLNESYAYTDSYYDRHILDMVGYPRPVNPDVLLRAYAARKGWPVLEFRNDPAGPRIGVDLYDALRPLGHPWLSPLNLNIEAVDLIPSRGPVIVAANHRSYLDPVALGMVVARRGRKLRFLGKKELFDAPVIGQFMRAAGQIRVDRGSGDGRSLREAEDALHRGEAIGIFPQGTIPRGDASSEPRLRGHSGVARLALTTGAPVVPVALWGTETIWPRRERIPKIDQLVRRAPVYVRVGEPMFLKASGGQDAPAKLTQQVMDAISALLPSDAGGASPPD